jgi:hypothetical protein
LALNKNAVTIRPEEEERSVRNGSIVAVPRPSAAIEEGAAAPSFTLPATTGLDVSRSDFKGKSTGS